MKHDALGLLILRLGLSWFLFVWAVNKILAPAQYAKIWGFFHGIDIGTTAPYVMGIAQIVLCAMMALGLWRMFSYAAGFIMHAVTVIVILPTLAAPFVIKNGFPTNRNQAIAVAALAGFAALWLLRRHDHWSVDAWLKTREPKSSEQEIS